jgi:WD40 repeat protein
MNALDRTGREAVGEDALSSPDAGAAERLAALWQQGERPDVDVFLAKVGPLPPSELAAVLRIDQRQRWQAGERVPAEDYLRRHPAVAAGVEAVVDLVYGEFLLRERLGERPDVDEYRGRFPHHADALQAQVELHRALAGGTEDGSGVAPVGAETLPALSPGRGEATRPEVPGYEILGELGRGGMGVVYQARQVGLNRIVALKVILAGTHAGEAELARFRTEAEAVARLQHPNVVQIHEVGERDGLPFFSLEYCPGGSLADRLDGTPWPARSAAELTETLGKVVQAAHERGVVHRDLKPGNVLLTADGTPKITDFGLAKRLDVEQGQTQSGAIVGTPSYMAPEQAAGKGKAVGPAADVYALGAVLYELLTGRPPFKGTTPLETVLQVLADEPVPPSRLQPKTPRDLETICLKCLHKEPHRRYASAGDLAADLGRFRAGQPVRARSTRAWERAVKWARRRPAIAALLALTLFVAALGFGGVLWQWQKTEAARREVAGKAEELEDNLYRTRIALAERDWTANNLGRMDQLLDACPPRLRGWEWDCLKRLRSGRLVTLRGHTDWVTRVAFSPDGKRLATGCADQTVRLWDTATGRAIHILRGHTGPVRGVAFSPDGQTVASASDDRTVRIWDAQTGREIRALEGHTDAVYSVAFSPDGKLLASASDDETAKVWETATGKELFPLRGHTSWVTRVVFSPDGKRLATTSTDQTVKVWDLASRRELWTLRGHGGWIFGVAFSPDPEGRYLASAGVDKTVRIWDLGTGQQLCAFRGHTHWVQSVAFSPDGKRLASAGADRTVKLWDVSRLHEGLGQEVLTLHGHTDIILDVAFSPDGRRLATGGFDEVVRIWDATPADGASQEVFTLRGHRGAAYGVAFSPDGKRLASTGHDGVVKVWDAATGREVHTLEGHTEPVLAVAFEPTGRLLASGSFDRTVRVWDAATGEELRPLQWQAGVSASVAFAPDGQRLAAGVEKDAIIRDTTTGQRLRTFQGHEHMINCLAFSPDGKLLASASDDKTVRVWDVESGRVVHTLKGHLGSVAAVSFSPDGKHLASGSSDQTARVWDLHSGQELLTLRGHTDTIFGVACSPRDGRYLATAGWDTTVKLWDAATGRELRTLGGHTDVVNGVSFSPDGKRLASSSDDGTIRVWDVTDLEQ